MLPLQHHFRNNSSNELLLEPFPTIFWVTHPRIKALVSKLELERMGTEYETILKEDLQKENGADGTLPEDSALASMKKAHLAYGQERRDLLLPQDWANIQQRHWESAFDVSTRGVAGIRNHATVKCLHAHAAHYWSGCRDNVVGKWVADRVVKMLQEK